MVGAQRHPVATNQSRESSPRLFSHLLGGAQRQCLLAGLFDNGRRDRMRRRLSQRGCQVQQLFPWQLAAAFNRLHAGMTRGESAGLV